MQFCCPGDLSRNRTVGLRIGKGEKLADIVGNMTAVAEGVLTSKCATVVADSKSLGDALPLCHNTKRHLADFCRSRAAGVGFSTCICDTDIPS